MSTQDLSDHGIIIPSGAIGEVRTTCPECSSARKKFGDKCLAVNVDKGTWFCHHCGWTGGIRKVDMSDSHTRTGSPPSIGFTKPAYTPPTTLPEKVISYFQGRGISAQTLSAEKIGFANGAIRFPYYRDGQVVNVKNRTMDKRFWMEKGAELCLYRFDALSGGGECLAICEGEIDALTLLEAGLQSVTSVPNGAPSPQAKNFQAHFNFLRSAEDIFSKYRRIVLAVDNDRPGQALEAELSRRIGVERCYRVQYPEGCKDANDVLVKHGATAVARLMEKATPYPIDGLYEMRDFADAVWSLYEKGVNRGVSTGWGNVDNFYTVRPGELTIITGIPSHGKSTWLDAMLMNIAKTESWSFALFSPENWPVERHIRSLLEKVEGKPFGKDGFESRRMDREDVSESMDWAGEHFYFIIPSEEVLSVDLILEKARSAILRYGVNGLLIDPWNEVEHLFGSLTETQYISKQLTKIRRFARMNGIHIWIVAHPRNLLKDSNGNYQPPTMYEISGGANWRNKADNGICIYRPDFLTDEVQILIQKVRFREIGRPGEARLLFVRDTGEYLDAPNYSSKT